jgi:hypothetical protein
LHAAYLIEETTSDKREHRLDPGEVTSDSLGNAWRMPPIIIFSYFNNCVRTKSTLVMQLITIDRKVICNKNILQTTAPI